MRIVHRSHKLVALSVGVFFLVIWVTFCVLVKPPSLPLHAHLLFFVFSVLAVGGLLMMGTSRFAGFQSLFDLLRGRSLFPLLVLIGFLGVSGMLVWFVTPVPLTAGTTSPGSQSGSNLDRCKSLLSGPGTVFVALLSLVTIYGFFATLAKLQEIEGRAIDYGSLHDRATKLIETEVKRVKGKKRARGFIKIMANAPTFGNISDRSSFGGFQDVLLDALSQPNLSVELLCLDWTVPCTNQHPQWLYPSEDFGEKGDHLRVVPTGVKQLPMKDIQTPLATFYNNLSVNLGKKEDAALALREALEVLVSVYTPSMTEGLKKTVNRKTYAAGTMEEPQKQVPLHFVLTSRGGVLFNTIDLPIKTGQRRDDQQIRVIAFESDDRGVLERLNQAFTYHTSSDRARLIPNPVVQITADLPEADFEDQPLR